MWCAVCVCADWLYFRQISENVIRVEVPMEVAIILFHHCYADTAQKMSHIKFSHVEKDRAEMQKTENKTIQANSSSTTPVLKNGGNEEATEKMKERERER